MDRKHNKKLVPFSKELRNNMTKEERHLWYDFLRNYPIRFIRQKIIGKYIVDFYSAKAKIVIEAREKYPEASLTELANIITLEYNYKIGKSGVNHRLKKIQEIADELK